MIGAGEMGEETLRYLNDEGAQQISIVNRSLERAEELAAALGRPGRAPWEQLHQLLVEADLVVSATGATEPIVTVADFEPIVAERYQRPLLDSRSGDSARLRSGDRRADWASICIRSTT